MSHEKPFVSIVMPVYNEEHFIERSLGAVLAQDYPAERIEILIADGMSTDRTIAVIQSLSGSERVRIIPNPERIQSHGLNKLVREAKGEYIIRLDGHTIIEPNYVAECVRLLQETDADNVGGAMDPVGITEFGRAIAAAGKSPFAVPTAFHVSGTPQYTDTVYMGAWQRRVFDRLDGFSTTVGVNEDYEFNYRIRESGGKIYFSPTIKSTYYSRQTLRHLARQYYRYGRSKVKTLRKHPTSLKLRQTVAPIFVVGLFGGYLLGFVKRIFLVIWFAAVLLYFALNAMFAVRVAKRHEQVSIWRVMLVFFIMHVTWGIGFWRELIRPADL
jgi:succinoglycan biosynthesis protein ExoA